MTGRVERVGEADHRLRIPLLVAFGAQWWGVGVGGEGLSRRGVWGWGGGIFALGVN